MNQNKTTPVSIKLKLFFASFRTEKLFLAAGIACLVNAWLYYFLTMLQVSKKGTFSAAFFLSFVWYDLTVMWFSRVFASSKESLFAKALPFSRELGTTYVSLFTEAVNTFTFLVAFVSFFILRKGNECVESSFAALIVFAFVHLVISVSAPFMQAARTKQAKFLSFILPLIPMEMAALLVKPLASCVTPLFARTPGMLSSVLAAILVVSCLVNVVLEKRVYEKR